MKKLYTRIKIRRENLGYTQRYVADMLGIDPGTYSRIESGKIDITVSRLCEIANFLGTTPDLFLVSDASIIAHKTIKNPKVTLQIDLDDSIKADIITLAFGDRVLEIKNK